MVVSLCPTCFTAAYWGCCDWSISLLLTVVISCHPSKLKFTGVTLCRIMCFTATHWSSSASSHVFHCHSLKWFQVVVTGVLLHLMGVAQCHPRFSIALHCGGFGLFQVSNSHSLGWLHVTPGVLLPHTQVAPCVPRSPKATFWGSFARLHVSHCCSFGGSA